MGLKDLNFHNTTIPTPGGDLPVRGLSYEEIVWIVERNRSAAVDIYASVVLDGALTIPDGKELAGTLLGKSPQIVAEIIAFGAGDGDEESVTAARKMPAGSQLEVIEAIGAATFATSGGAKNVLEIVVRLVVGARGLLEDLRAAPAA